MDVEPLTYCITRTVLPQQRFGRSQILGTGDFRIRRTRLDHFNRVPRPLHELRVVRPESSRLKRLCHRVLEPFPADHLGRLRGPHLVARRRLDDPPVHHPLERIPAALAEERRTGRPRRADDGP